VSVIVNKAICLHAQADDLKFLNPVRNRMAKLLSVNFRGVSFGDHKSEVDAKIALEKKEVSFVIILAHGGDGYIRGGEYIHRVTREIEMREKFLTKQDLALFNGKVVFCMSCDSNSLASASLHAGALAFVGFNSVLFNRFDVSGNPTTNHEFELHAQRLISEGVKFVLERFVTGRATLDEAVEFLRLWICQEVVRFVRKYKSVKQRREIAALLLRMKDGVRYHGERGITFVRDN